MVKTGTIYKSDLEFLYNCNLTIYKECVENYIKDNDIERILEKYNFEKRCNKDDWQIVHKLLKNKEFANEELANEILIKIMTGSDE